MKLNSQNHQISFVKMSGAGNDFVIFDARKNEINLSKNQIIEISNRKNIGCDQLIILKNSDEANCLMEIYNPDGSISSACGNATRCVASILIQEKNIKEVKIKTAAGILQSWQNGDLISVNMGKPKFLWQEIPLSKEMDGDKISLFGFDFFYVNMGNPHTVTFLEEKLSDEKFFDLGPKIETHNFFPNKTNVEFANIISDNLIEVRVWERGAGETLACGSGACAVAVLALKNGLVKSKKITTRFKGGDLIIELSDDSVIMTGGYKKIFDGKIDEKSF